MNASRLPVPSREAGLAKYLDEIHRFPLLEPEEEFEYARAWRNKGDTQAAHQLVTSHLRLAAKMALGYRGYGLPIADVISEANLGLMQAVKRFDPDRGHRLATYAMWWIRAAIQEYILRSWSLVKISTTAAQKKLFFNLRRAKSAIRAYEDGDLRPEHVKQIAESLNVSETDVIQMNRRLAGTGDASLNVTMGNEEGAPEWQEWISDDDGDQASALAEADEAEKRHAFLLSAMDALNDREKRIFMERRLNEEPLTLEKLAKEFGVSRERIRQIETRAFEKVQKKVRELARERGLLENVSG